MHMQGGNLFEVPSAMEKEASFLLKKYRRIYRLESLAKKYPDYRLRIRNK